MAKLFSPRAEAQALKALCSRNREVSGTMIGSVTRSFFHKKESLEVYDRIVKFNERKGSVPSLRVLVEELSISQQAKDFLSSSDVRAPRDIEESRQLVDSLDKYRRTRLLYSLCKDTVTELGLPAVDIDALQEKVVSKFTEIQTRRTTDADVIHIGKDSNALAKIEELIYSENNDQVIPTGFSDFDDQNGGFFRGSLQGIAANTGGGKSLLCNALAINQSRLGYKIVLVPLEMAVDQMLARTMSSETGYNSIDIFLRKLATGEKDDAFKKMRRLNKEIASKNGRYTIFKPREDMTMEQLLAAVHSFGADVIYIDYLNLLAGVSDSEDSWRKLGNAARYAKVYAENNNKVVVILTQVNDEGAVRYSRAVVEHCNGFWTFVTTKESREAGYMNIIPIKSRNQVPDPFTLRANFSRMQVMNMSAEDKTKIREKIAADASAKQSVQGKPGARKATQQPLAPKRDKAPLDGV